MKGLESYSAIYISLYVLVSTKTISKFPRLLKVLERVFFSFVYFFLIMCSLVQADNGSQAAAFLFVFGN